MPWTDIAERVMVGIASAATHAYRPSGVPMFRNKNIKEGKLDDSDLLFLDSTYEQQHRNKRLKTGDVLTVRTGNPGVSAVVPAKYAGAQCFTSLVTRPKPNVVDSDYLCTFVNSPAGMDQIKMAQAGAAQQNVNVEMLEKILVPIPPLHEQKQIACLNACMSRTVWIVEALIIAKLQVRQGLMQQLLTGQRRFREFLRLNGTHHTPCGNLPRDWSLVPMEKVFVPVKRRNGTATERVLTASGEHGMVDQRDFFNRSVAGRSIEDYYLLQRGEFAYNRSLMNGYPFGAIKRLDLYDQGALSTLYLCFALNRTDCDSDFLVHFFESGLLNGQLRGIAQMGARAHGLLNVTASDFFAMSMPLPSHDEQRRIATVLNAADREICQLRQQLALLREQKKGLMQKLLTGEVRIRGGAIRG